ncbi:hypothetical protein LTR87_017877 [Friedmanniomyces endolithicus]|nr:hypothetical protein LTS09_018164 [Friedmanniomyces endolithicus]KAK0857162.1 hypothetical protein LTR87_017877 [Friedmanniomyces endolithicus]
MEDDPAGKTPPASPRPESCGPVTVAAPAEPHTAPLVPIRPTVTAPLGPLEAPSPSVEPYHTASIACPASTSPITQPVGAAVASLTSPTTNPSNVEASSSSFADAAAESPGPASPQPRSPPLSMHTVGSSEDLLVPPTCAKSEATPKSTSPMVDPLAASNEESISLSSNARSRLLHDDVSSATFIGLQALSPLSGDVSPVSEDDDETEIETVRIEPNRVAKPPAVERRRVKHYGRAIVVPTGPQGKTFPSDLHTTGCNPCDPEDGVTVAPARRQERPYPKGSSYIERPGDAIRASYGKFGLDAQRLIIVPEAQPFKPLSLFMSSAAKVGAKLTPRRMKVLQKRRDELLASLPAVGDLATGSADIDLIKGLCNLYSEPVYPQDMMDLIRALR